MGSGWDVTGELLKGMNIDEKCEIVSEAGHGKGYVPTLPVCRLRMLVPDHFLTLMVSLVSRFAVESYVHAVF